jgi:uncharacterized membrane protein YgcG
MANKPAPRNWNDIQVAIATVSMASTLIFWNMFAGPDRESAVKRAQEQAAIPPQPVVTAAPIVIAQPTPLGDGKILFGGSAPQTQIIVQTGGGGGGGGGDGGGGGGAAAGGGGGGAAASTGSS